MNSKDLIYCGNKAEELRKALHRKNKKSQYDCKEYRIGMLTVLFNLGFITDQDEYMDIVNKAGAWDKELRGAEDKPSSNKLTDEELAELFGYCARLASMVAPADAKHYYGFTFDGAVKDTFYGLSMLYAGEGISHNIEEFRLDELYGPTLKQMLSDIRRILDDTF